MRVRHRPPDAVPEGILKPKRGNPAHLGHLLTGQAVAKVVPGPSRVMVHHLVNEFLANGVGDELRQLQVAHLGLARDVVLLADAAVIQQEHHRRRDVARVNVEPGARGLLIGVGVDINLLAVHHLLDALGDELLWVLPLAKRVHHVDNHERNLVRVLVSDADVLSR